LNECATGRSTTGGGEPRTLPRDEDKEKGRRNDGLFAGTNGQE